MNDLLTWLQSGASLDTAGAITVLAAFVRFCAVPAVSQAVLKAFKLKVLGDNTQRLIVLVCSELLVGGVDLVRPVPNMTFEKILALGAVVAGAAIGVHQATKGS